MCARLILALCFLWASLCAPHEARAAQAAASVVHFEFSADHGAAWRECAAYEKLYCSVQRVRTGKTVLALFCMGDASDTYQAEAGRDIYAELTELAARLNLRSWSGTGSGERFTGRPEWELVLRFSDGTQIKAGGVMGKKMPPDFERAEREILSFFREKIAAGTKFRRIEDFSFEKGAESQPDRVYSLHASLNQRSVMIVRHGEPESIVNFFIDAAAFDEFSAILSRWNVAALRGFRGVQDGSADDFRLSLKYDTFESAELEGNLKSPGGAPESFSGCAQALEDFFDAYGEMYRASRTHSGADAEAVREFYFSVSGAAAEDHQSYQIIEVMTPGGRRLAMIAEKFCDDSLTVEALLTLDDVHQLLELGRRLNLRSWDGFRGFQRGARGKKGFSLIITSDHGDLRARGYAVFPPDYEKKSAELLTFLDGIAERHRQKARAAWGLF